MMMTKLKPTISAAVALTLVSVAYAKDLKTEITVDRTIVPVEREAVRLGSLTPKLMSSPVRQRALTLADYTTPASLTRSMPTLDPAAYADTFALSPYKGYASIGYFPVFNIGASAGYRFIDTSHSRLGAWMQYNGYSYKEPGKEASKGTYDNNSFTLGARFDQRVGDKSTFGAGLSYTFAATGLPDDFINKSQNANIFDADLSWWSRAGLVGYHIKAAYSHFGFGKKVLLSETHQLPAIDSKAAGENRITFNAGIGYFGSSSAPRGGIEICADFISRYNGFEQIEYQTAAERYEPRFAPINAKTLGVTSITPYYAFNNGSIHGRIGAKIEISSGGEGKKFHIAPAVMLDWNVTSQFAIYLRAEGGEHLNSLHSLYNYCPFINAAWQYQRSHVPMTIDVGMNIGPFAGFSAKLFGGYAIANDWLMPQLTTLSDKSGTQSIDISNFGAYDLKGWHAGIALDYDWRSIVKTGVSAEFAPQKPDKGYYLWRDRAKYVIKAYVEACPFKKLSAGVGYELRGKRCNYAFDQSEYDAIELKSVNNLYANASYSLNEAFTIFARGENLLNKRYYLISDIYAQGIKGLVGVSYKF